MKLGTATHCAILEPERFEIEYVEAPCVDRRTKDGKALWSELEQSGKIILSSDEYTKVVEMASAMRRHELASKLITGEARVSSLNVETEIWC